MITCETTIPNQQRIPVIHIFDTRAGLRTFGAIAHHDLEGSIERHKGVLVEEQSMVGGGIGGTDGAGVCAEEWDGQFGILLGVHGPLQMANVTTSKQFSGRKVFRSIVQQIVAGWAKLNLH